MSHELFFLVAMTAPLVGIAIGFAAMFLFEAWVK